MPDGEEKWAMWRAVLRDLWTVFQRYPLLAFWPAMLYMRFFEREALDRMIHEALDSDIS